MLRRAGRASLRWWHGWAPLVLMPGAVLLFTSSCWPRWIVMWTLAFTIYCGCKWLTWRRTPLDRVPGWRHAAYLLTWPGLDAAAFLRGQVEFPAPSERMGPRPEKSLDRPRVVLWNRESRGSSESVSRRLDWHGRRRVGSALWAVPPPVLRLAPCRRGGATAHEQAVVSTGLGEFWGRRWNTAFRDLTHRFLFRPLTRRSVCGGHRGRIRVQRVGARVGDLWPAGGGFGGPTVFFALQGIGILVERSGSAARWVWLTAPRLALRDAGPPVPAPFLFHPPFVKRIVVPFMQSWGHCDRRTVWPGCCLPPAWRSSAS